MRDRATIIHADGRSTTIEAPLFGSVEVKLGDGVSCITARNMLGSTVNTVCMGTPQPVATPSAGAGKSSCGCK